VKVDNQPSKKLITQLLNISLKQKRLAKPSLQAFFIFTFIPGFGKADRILIIT
jgi:hypothetical protein